jgi:hypothetical protein
MAENEDGSVAIVLSGCGTSGRLAFMTVVSTPFVVEELMESMWCVQNLTYKTCKFSLLSTHLIELCVKPLIGHIINCHCHQLQHKTLAGW